MRLEFCYTLQGAVIAYEATRGGSLQILGIDTAKLAGTAIRVGYLKFPSEKIEHDFLPLNLHLARAWENTSGVRPDLKISCTFYFPCCPHYSVALLRNPLCQLQLYAVLWAIVQFYCSKNICSMNDDTQTAKHGLENAVHCGIRSIHIQVFSKSAVWATGGQ